MSVRGKKQPKYIYWLERVLDAAPLSLPAALATLTSICIGLLLIDSLKTPLVVGLALPPTIAVFVLMSTMFKPSVQGSKKEWRIVNILALLFVVLWAGFNMRYTSQHVFTDRDPATYGVTGVWLIKNDNLRIPKSTELKERKSVQTTSAGFYGTEEKGGYIESQGNHALPVLLGLAGRVVGNVHLFRLMPLLGGLALLAVYGFARTLTKPRWALFAIVLLGFSLPMIYFSRDTYTEPLTMAFLFSGLGVLYEAIKKRRNHLWFIAGLMIGASGLTRIDAWLPIAGLSVFSLAYCVTATRKLEQSSRIRFTALLFAGLAITGLIGWLNIAVLSTAYYKAHQRLFLPQLPLVILPLLLALATAFIDPLRRGVKKIVVIAEKNTWQIITVTSVAFTALLLCPGLISDRVLVELRSQNSTPYGAQTTEWIAWYIGIPLVVGAFAGLLVCLHQFLTKRSYKHLLIATVIALPSLTYILMPNITPDQIWAIRRFLPVTIPGFIILSTIVFEKIYEFAKNLPHYNKVYTVLAIILIAVPVFTTSNSFLRVRIKTQIAPITTLCGVLPKDAAVLWLGKGRLENVMPTRAYCGVPAAGYALPVKSPAENSQIVTDDKPPRSELATTAQEAKRNNKQAVVAVFASQQSLLSKSDFAKLTPVTGFGWVDIEQSYSNAPQQTVRLDDAIYAGLIDVQGNIEPLKTK